MTRARASGSGRSRRHWLERQYRGPAYSRQGSGCCSRRCRAQKYPSQTGHRVQKVAGSVQTSNVLRHCTPILDGAPSSWPGPVEMENLKDDPPEPPEPNRPSPSTKRRDMSPAGIVIAIVVGWPGWVSEAWTSRSRSAGAGRSRTMVATARHGDASWSSGGEIGSSRRLRLRRVPGARTLRAGSPAPGDVE